MKYKGYTGEYLRVDLTRSSVKTLPLPPDMARHYLGGLGFCAKILWDEVSEETDPLGPDNRLIFATGPITGAFFSPSGRFTVAAKSPLGHWGEAHSGGTWGAELKYAGYDMIVFQGRAPSPVYVFIDDEQVEITKADHLWGKDTSQTTIAIREQAGDETVKVACIGLGGENTVMYACIANEFYHVSGRSGMGAVMGSKNLKAVAVRGTGSVEPYDPEGYMEAATERYKKVTTGRWLEMSQSSLGRYGTPCLVMLENEIGRLPTKNHWTGVFDEAEKISGELIRERYRASRGSCFSCAIQCKYISRIDKGRFGATITGGPEYESIMALGSNCSSADMEAIIHANLLCNLYGIDTISCGKVVSFAMECYEKGILTKEDADGLDLSWGNSSAVIDLIHKIVRREGLGKILSEGVDRAAQAIGKGADRYAMHVKGLEVSGQDGRAQQSVGLTHAIAARGADHLTALSSLEEIGYSEVIEDRFGSEKLEEIQNLLSTTYKALIVKDVEDLYVLTDSLIICKYGTMWPPIYYFDDFARVIPPRTGMEEYANISEVRLTAERIVSLRRSFNIREGLDKRDDTLPKRFLKEPMPHGPGKGHVCELDVMLDEYYRLRDWDIETGLPTRSSLEHVGLERVAETLGKKERVVA